MSDPLLVVVFVVCAGVSLGSSWVLVSRLERVGARLGLSEALLGMLAALAADAPEITAAVTALAAGQARIGAGVVIGSNVFNLAALLGLAAVLAGRIALHRRVVEMEGIVALWIAGVCLAVVLGVLSAVVGLLLSVGVLVPYLVILGVGHERLGHLGLPAGWVNWISEAVDEEELELEVAIHPQAGGARDVSIAAGAVLVVVGASVVMEQSASRLGSRHAIPQIIVGGLVLAAVTSLPNAVAAVYLARRGRGAATLSTAMNSNALNVTAGLLLPGAIVGLGAPSGPGTLIAVWYLALTAFALGCAYRSRGLRRAHGAAIILGYIAFTGMLLASAYRSPVGMWLSAAVLALAATITAAWMLLRTRRRPIAAQAPQRATGHGGGVILQHAGELSTGGRHHDGHERQGACHAALRSHVPEARRASLIDGWQATRVWYLAVAICAVIAAVDAILGHHVILIGLLIAGPCCGLLTGRWKRTATAGIWALALAVILGIPDQIWGTPIHLALLGAVAAVTIVSITSAAVIEHIHRPT